MKLRKQNDVIMKRTIGLLGVFFLLAGCNNEDCDDCLELESKILLVEDVSGNNLIFGDSAIYDPDSIKLLDTEGREEHLHIDYDMRNLSFGLYNDLSKCYLYLDSLSVDTISFVLSERKSTRCCGNFTYATKTFVNNNEIETSETIKIVK